MQFVTVRIAIRAKILVIGAHFSSDLCRGVVAEILTSRLPIQPCSRWRLGARKAFIGFDHHDHSCPDPPYFHADYSARADICNHFRPDGAGSMPLLILSNQLSIIDQI